MLDDKSRKALFFEAGIIVVLIYFLSIGITSYLDEWRMEQLDDQYDSYSINHEASKAVDNFYKVFGKTNCNFSRNFILSEYEYLKELGTDIISFKDRIATWNDKKHELKKRAFLLAQLENLNKLYLHNAVCENKLFPLLYFVDGDINSFDKQSLILQQFDLTNENVLVYTIDLNYIEDPAIGSLITYYNIQNHNTIFFGNLNNTDGNNLGFGKLNEELERLKE